MRKANREIKDRSEIIDVMKSCQVCRLALNDEDGIPYILPLNFGLSADNESIKLYFHSAAEGHKLDLIKKDARACFEMDCSHLLQYFEEKGYCTYAYDSVIGKGRIEMIEEEEEKVKALKILMDHYHPGKNAYFNPDAIPRTAVYSLEVSQISGKRKMPK